MSLNVPVDRDDSKLLSCWRKLITVSSEGMGGAATFSGVGIEGRDSSDLTRTCRTCRLNESPKVPVLGKRASCLSILRKSLSWRKLLSESSEGMGGGADTFSGEGIEGRDNVVAPTSTFWVWYPSLDLTLI